MKLTYHGVIYSKKNSKSVIKNARTGKPMIISSKSARKMEDDMVTSFVLQLGGKRTTEGYYDVSVALYRKDNVRRDLDNGLSSIMDGLVKAGAIPDDSVRFVRSMAIKDMGIDKKDPRAVISIVPCDMVKP